MRLPLLLLLQVLLFLPFTSLAASSNSTPPIENHNKKEVAEAQRANALKTYNKLPLYFIENKGQADEAVRFYERGAGHATFFTEDGVVIALTKSEGIDNKKITTEALRLAFVGASKNTKLTAGEAMPGHVNYFTGNDKSKWRSNIPTYGALTYEDVYKNIDIKFYGNNKNIEHDVIVHPGGDPSLVKFVYKDVKDLNVTEAGDLEVSLKNGKLIQQRPFIYQEIKGERVVVGGSYRLIKGEDGTFEYGFTVASYDHAVDLVIDPVLVYSTYLGGSDADSALGIAVDNTGATYITGQTISPDFPVFPPPLGPLGIQVIVSNDAFVTKIDAAGSAYVYSTIIGGSGFESGAGIAIDGAGAAYITGQTDSVDFPIVGAVQGLIGGFTDAFITKVDAAGGVLVYSTYLGGGLDDLGYSIAVDNTGAAYVSGWTSSTDFPLLNAKQAAFGGGFSDAFVTKLDPGGAAVTYSTYLGGTLNESGNGIAVNSFGEAYVTGFTNSADFPVQNPLQGTFGGADDAFVTKFSAAGTAHIYSTFLGGTGSDLGESIALDSSGAAYVTGSTNDANFPVVAPIQGAFGGVQDAFISRIDPAGSALTYSTYLGGSDIDVGMDIALNSNGFAYVTGLTVSPDFPLQDPIQSSLASANFFDVFVTKVNPAGTLHTYSTYLGGTASESASSIAVGSSGAAYVAGQTASTDFPVLAPIQATNAGNFDGFTTKISAPVIALSVVPDSPTVARGEVFGYTVTAINTTAVRQCFNYWENMTLPNGSTVPATGELFGPVRLCLDGWASQNAALTHNVPNGIALGNYVLHSFVGAYNLPELHFLVDESHTSIDVTAFPPPPGQ
ncbi:MAG: SBBP repeat-containing protein [Thermodesulfobacteriota bacterium]